MSVTHAEFPSWEGPGVGRFMESLDLQMLDAHGDPEPERGASLRAQSNALRSVDGSGAGKPNPPRIGVPLMDLRLHHPAMVGAAGRIYPRWLASPLRWGSDRPAAG